MKIIKQEHLTDYENKLLRKLYEREWIKKVFWTDIFNIQDKPYAWKWSEKKTVKLSV